ncbi:MAG: nucleotidyltransferase domain-containing protein [Desulfovibrio sp.]|jgi:predicted nucleotidyltransferase|nr:nucleotidyltransferase domain-containing protein [Desulfovibrio sp.]
MAVDVEAIRHIVREFADEVRKVMPVEKVVLFGSYATGTATTQSDVDVCFFLEDFQKRQRVDIIAELLNISGKYKGIFFEPLVFPVSEIQNGNSFVKKILEYGYEV